ncbi:trypsin-like peptidase domain-containing protein [Candidatus Nomurabacteria bacterium]|nr:trypsin-like peptidase domain-containing protein [Candidatus Nomurabacteria bacterium]
MKVLIINSIFILLSSTVLTTGALLVWNQEGVFLQSDNAAAVANSNDAYREEKNEDDFIAFNEIIDKALKQNDVTEHDSFATEEVDNDPEENSESDTSITPPENLGDAIVNIVCVQATDQYKRRISGTGFFISSRGVILTNAHVGQFLLLAGVEAFGETSCSATTGIEGAPTYDVKLLYISPTWLLENANSLNDNNPRGTGENDFALLFVTSNTGNELPNSSFSYLPPATNPLSKALKDDTVILVGYPKEDGAKVGKRTTATTTVTELYTFKTGGGADIFSLGSSPLGHTGTSGGPVIDHFGRSIGVITTKESGTTILNAITMAHIDRSIKSETGIDLISILQGDLNQRATLFNETISPILQAILVKSND